MVENLTSGNMTFRRQNLPKRPHSPLTVCSELVACDQEASFVNSGMVFDSFINFRIEIVNDFTCQRKYDHSTPSYGFETPIKKPLNQKNFSPDLESVADYGSPITRWKPMSPLTDSAQDCLDTTWNSSSPTTFIHYEQYTTSNKQKERPLRGQYLQEEGRHVESQRAGILNRGVDWEHRKNLYVHSVTQNTTENPRENHGVMSELVNLMNHVANQTTGSSGRQWQHPSDLTRRNYQRRFGKQSVTLHEWWSKNCPTYMRFASVPEIFKRDHFP